MDKHQSLLPLMLVLFFTISFALTNSMAGLAYTGGTDPLTVATARFIVPTIVLAILLWITGAKLLFPKQDAVPALCLGLITAVFSFAILNAIEILSVSLAILIFFLFPLFTSLIVALMGWEKLTATTAIAAIVAFCGLGLTLGVEISSLSLVGILYALVGAIGLAIVSAISSRVIKSGDSRQVTFYIVSTASVCFIVFSLIKYDPQIPINTDGWIGLIGTSIFYACGIIGYFAAISMIGPAKATLYSYIEPLFTIFAAFVFLGELLMPLQFVGALIIVGALTASGLAGLKNNN